MRWYVSFDGKTEGPLEENAVAMLAAAVGQRLQVADEQSRQWMPVEQSPFAANVPQAAVVADATPIASVKAKEISKAIWLIPAGVLGLFVGIVVLAIALRPEPPPPPMPSQASPGAEQTTPTELTLTQKLQEASSLPLAIQLLRPMFQDTQEEAAPGAQALAVWCAMHLDWNSLSGIPETSRAKVMKDPEAERGKRLCSSGTIIEIHNDRSSGQSIYSGGIQTSSFDIVRFFAVHSTGDLVEHGVGRICGIVTGTQSYSNSGGGVTHAAFIVGMFDLPENKRQPTPLVPSQPTGANAPVPATVKSGAGKKVPKLETSSNGSTADPPSSTPAAPAGIQNGCAPGDLICEMKRSARGGS